MADDSDDGRRDRQHRRPLRSGSALRSDEGSEVRETFEKLNTKKEIERNS